MQTTIDDLAMISEAWVLGELEAEFASPIPRIDTIDATAIEMPSMASAQCPGPSLSCWTSAMSRCCTTYTCGPVGTTSMCGC